MYPKAIMGLIKGYLLEFERAILEGRTVDNPAKYFDEVCRSNWTAIMPIFKDYQVKKTAVHCATQAGHYELMVELLQRFDTPRIDVIYNAIASGNLRSIMYCLEGAPIDKAATTNYMCSVIENGHVQLVELFRDLGATDYHTGFVAATTAGNITLMRRMYELGGGRKPIFIEFDDVPIHKQLMVIKQLTKYRTPVYNPNDIICNAHNVRHALQYVALENCGNIFRLACRTNNTIVMTLCLFIGVDQVALANCLEYVLSSPAVKCKSAIRIAVELGCDPNALFPQLERLESQKLFESGYVTKYTPSLFTALWSRDRQLAQTLYAGQVLDPADRDFIYPSRNLDCATYTPVGRFTFCRWCNVKFRGHSTTIHEATLQHSVHALMR